MVTYEPESNSKNTATPAMTTKAGNLRVLPTPQPGIFIAKGPR